MTTEVLIIKETGKLTLPEDITERYQFKKETRFRQTHRKYINKEI